MELIVQGKVAEIKDGMAYILYLSGERGCVSMEKMPKGIKVYDRVIVTLKVTLKSVRLKPEGD